MFPHKNPLPIPQLLATPKFETVLEETKSTVLNYLSEHAPDDALALQQTLENEASLITKVFEALSVIKQNQTRQTDYKALQTFGMYATEDDMVDLIVSRLGVVRQIIDPGDPNAFPPVPPIKESNDALLTRYFLAVHALPSTGTRAGYRYHAMTLGGRPKITIEGPEENKVVITYQFEQNDYAGKTKDAQARQVEGGVVDCYILSHQEDGTPDQALIDFTQSYMTRDNIGQECDLLTVKAPTIKRWNCEATIYVSKPFDENHIRQIATDAVRAFGIAQHRLLGRIELSKLDEVLIGSTGGHHVDITQPSAPIRCNFSEAPYLEQITIAVVSEDV